MCRAGLKKWCSPPASQIMGVAAGIFLRRVSMALPCWSLVAVMKYTFEAPASRKRELSFPVLCWVSSYITNPSAVAITGNSGAGW